MKLDLTGAMAKRFDVLVTAAAWVSVVLRLASFLLFPSSAFWARATVAALAVLLGLTGLLWIV